MSKQYDIAIIGGGPAGLTCALYSARGGLSTVIIEKTGMGGQAALTQTIDNYPGIDEVQGFELGMKMEAQIRKFDVEIVYDEVTDIDMVNKVIKTSYSGDINTKTIVLAMGASPKKLGIVGEEKFTGHGVCYCAICDGAFFKGKPVVVLGGGNTAVEDALYLTRFASKVYLVHRRGELRASKILADTIKNSSVEIIWDTITEKINGENKVSSITIKNVKTNEMKDLAVEGVFIAIGQKPRTDILKGKLTLDEEGYIPTNDVMCTNISGVYAAGDIRTKSYRQIVTATSDGAIASLEASQYLISI